MNDEYKDCMWNNFSDVEGECNAHCYIGDNYGDGSATFRCQLPKNHDGSHQEKFRDDKCILTWEQDERCYHTDGNEIDNFSGSYRCTKCYKEMSECNYQYCPKCKEILLHFEDYCKHRGVYEVYLICDVCKTNTGCELCNPVEQCLKRFHNCE